MEEVYDLGQFPYVVAIYIQKTKVHFNYYSTTEEILFGSSRSIIRDSRITYDKQKMNIKSWGKARFISDYEDDKNEDDGDEGDEEDDNEDDDDVYIDNFRDELYRVFKKDKEEWNGDDLFLLKAVSDFIRLSIEDLIKESKEGEIKSIDQLHYVFVVPSEWEEDIREALLRPTFIQSNLISKDDHSDRLLFCSDLEPIFYPLMNYSTIDFKKIRKTIFCLFVPVSKSEILVKLNLVSTVNYLFDLPGSLLYPNVECSNQLSLTINTFKNGIRDFINDELPLSIQEEIIQIIMDKEYKEFKDYEEYKEYKEFKNYEEYKEYERYKKYRELKDYIEYLDYEENEEYIKQPLITDTSRWELDKRQLDLIESICIFKICSQICKNTTNNIDGLLSNDIIKEYNFLSCFDLFSSGISLNKKLLKWSRHLLTYNRIYSRNKNIKYTSDSFDNIIDSITYGVSRYVLVAINNGNIYSRPRILPVKNSANSSSIFQESKPDAIMNIDISIESTILSCSLLNENGFVKEVWNHNHFLKDKSLCSLGSFFNFSETTTLNVKSSFIEFAKDNLIDDISVFSQAKKKVLHRFIRSTKKYLRRGISFLSRNKKASPKLNASDIEAMLRNNNSTEDVLVSTQQQIYIKTFLLLYMTYIKYIISSKLSDIVDSNMEIKIGYNITTEKILLNRLFNTKEGLKDIVYASGLIQKDENSKKLRITAQGERIMYLLQRSLALSFPIKSYFVLAQLHENYIQLTLNQVVTGSSSEEKDQEAIIIHDRIIHIPNIYTSLCLNMWSNILEDSSLIKLCDIHQEYSDNDLLEIFSLKNQTEFTKNLKRYISKDNLSNNLSLPATDEINIQFSVSCNCKVRITVRDIIDVSFQPVLQDIVSLVSASFINKELFGKFWSIKYFFQLIQFDYNSLLHDSLIKMLKETTEDVIIEQGVDIPHYVIPKSLNQLLQPVLHQRPISYKEFQVGTLHLVYGDRYGFSFYPSGTAVSLEYKSKTTNTKAVLIDTETVLPLFKKGDIINDLPKNLTFYINPQEKVRGINLCMHYSKLTMSCDLNSDGTVRSDDIQEIIIGPDLEELKIVQDIPISISVVYEAYSGSLILRTNLVGQDINIKSPVILGAPMHLRRF